MEVNPSIFKGYDIRGRYPGELDEEVARKIGQAFAALLCRGFGGQRPIVIARDMRKSSPSLKTAILAGLFSQGAEVWDIGEVSIDVFYYALGMFDVPGIMVTASHNPKEWNGFKVYKRNGEGVDPLRLRAFVEKPFTERGGGKVEVRDVLPEYVKKIRGFFGVESSRPARTITVVIDAGNGMMGKIVPLVLDPECIEGVDLISLYFELDGNFPHHPPNPLEEENLRDLAAKVKETGADLGIAFDG
ncbi:phosphomannomutase/phosphoglucomutase, partial [Candidatus Azambacteria bacterium]|nr:phosphomannomutase/phosphoglucomutase [Candidatus Azambacteria bacterium]